MPSPKSHPLTSDALAYWRFDGLGDVEDLTGNGNTALEAGVVPLQVGQFGGARGPFSTSGYFAAADSETLRPQVLTFAVWAYYATSSQTSFAKIAGKENFFDDLSNGAYQIIDTPSSVTFAAPYGAGGVSQQANVTVFEGDPPVGWHHIGGTIDQFGKVKGYFDGVQLSERQIPVGQSVYYDTADVYFGKDGNSLVPQPFNGWLEEAVLYSEVKSDAWFANIAGLVDLKEEVEFSGVADHYSLFLKVDGLEPVLWQYASVGEPQTFKRSIITCLRAGQEASTTLDLATMASGMSAMTFELEDVKDDDGTSYFGRLFAPARFQKAPYSLIKEGDKRNTYLDPGATEIPLGGDGDNINPGINHIGQEAISVGSVSADLLSGVTRGLYPCVGSEFGRAFPRYTEEEGGFLPAVSPFPYSWIGRRVALYVTQWDRGAQAWVDEDNARLLWVGRISDRINQIGDDRTWQISCTSILDDLSNKKIAQNLTSDTLKPGLINLSGDPGRKFSIRAIITESGVRRFLVNGVYEVPKREDYDVFSLTYAVNRLLKDEGDFNFSITAGILNSKPFLKFSSFEFPEVHVTISWSADRRTNRCHIGRILGWEGPNGRNIFDVPARTDFANPGEFIIEGDPYTSYAPLHPDYRGDTLDPANADYFWDDQGDNDSPYAMVCLPDAVSDPELGDKKDVYLAYDGKFGSVGLELSDDESVEFNRGLSILAFAGSKDGEDPQEVKQVWVPRFQTDSGSRRYPFEMLLYPLLSTGSQSGYNHPIYDKLPYNCSVGVQADLVDIDSFLEADRSIKSFDTAVRFPYSIDKPNTWMELAQLECRLFGYAVVWRKGRITLTNVLGAEFDRYSTVIDRSSGVDASEFPTVTMSTDTVVNQYDMKVGYNINSGDYAYNFVISDALSIFGLEVSKTTTLNHPGIIIPEGSSPRDLLEPFFSDRWLAVPNPTVTVSLSSKFIDEVFVGDKVAFVSDRIQDPLGSGTYATLVYATVLGVTWNYSQNLYTGSVTLLLHSLGELPTSLADFEVPDERLGSSKLAPAWGPSAAIDSTYYGGSFLGGINKVDKQLYMTPWYYGSSPAPKDATTFQVGDQVRIAKLNAEESDTDTFLGPFTVASTFEQDGENILSLPLDSDMSSLVVGEEYVIVDDYYAGVSNDQRSRGTWMADSVRRQLSSGLVGGPGILIGGEFVSYFDLADRFG